MIDFCIGNSIENILISELSRLGRNTFEALKAEHKDIIKYLKQGSSLNNIVRITGKSKPTVIKIKKILQL